MPAFKLSLGKSMPCMSRPSEVHDPNSKDKERDKLSETNTRSSSSSFLSGCTRSLSNLRDVLHGSKRHTDKASGSSPRSILSSDFLNPMKHEVLLDGCTWELKPGSEGQVEKIHRPPARSKKLIGDSPVYPGGTCVSSSFGGSLDADFYDFKTLVCKRCCEKFKNLDAVESHHFSKHAVTELAKEDTSRTIVEIIFDRNWSTSPSLPRCVQIDKVLKVSNLQNTVSQFEEYREMVKIRASKLVSKHSRCLADGNELLRFCGSTLACPLGVDGSSSLCTLGACGVCRILRHGFTKKHVTTSTSGKAFEGIEIEQGNECSRKALLVCRVIAGRVHKPLEDMKEMEGQFGFDSVAGEVGGAGSKIEDLYSLDPRALLPCFVVVCD